MLKIETHVTTTIENVNPPNEAADLRRRVARAERAIGAIFSLLDLEVSERTGYRPEHEPALDELLACFDN